MAGTIADAWATMLRELEEALLPRRCAFCGTRTREGEGLICRGCDDDLPRIESPPPPSSSPFRYVVAPLAYEFPVDAAIKALKFRRRLYYGPALAQLLCDAAAGLPDDIDAVLPVPLHWRRKFFRGFNQARELAMPLARKLRVPLVDNVTRKRATPSQSGLHARERARNLRAAFAVRGDLPYRHVLIIDDVITTGATARQLAKALLRAGAGSVSVLAVARA